MKTGSRRGLAQNSAMPDQKERNSLTLYREKINPTNSNSIHFNLFLKIL
jgi:hypothetical protein